MTVQPMHEQHIDAVADLEQQCFSAPCSAQGLREYLSMRGQHFLVALEQDRVVGYIGLYTVLDEGVITNVAVNPAHRRKGVATALMVAQMTYCFQSGCTFMTLEARESNEGARGLYESLGFEQVGVRPAFYTNPTEAAVLYTKTLKGERTTC